MRRFVRSLAPFRGIFPFAYAGLFRRSRHYLPKLSKLVARTSEELLQDSRGAVAPLFLDFGANEGLVLREFLKALPGFTFWAYEPQPALAKRASRRNRRVQVKEVAISDFEGVSLLYLPDSFSLNVNGRASLQEANLNNRGLARTIKCRTVDVVSELQAAKRLGHEYIAAKLDVEGEEFKIIDALQHQFNSDFVRLIDFIAVEFHEECLPPGTSIEEYEGKLRSMGAVVCKWV